MIRSGTPNLRSTTSGAYRVNHLKIAQSFINRSSTDPESAATIRVIVNFAHDIGIVVIAQGAETRGGSSGLF
jgi:EAL domain-containing protein (putative c-di-GMP-specific phosphodiesterase class I)